MVEIDRGWRHVGNIKTETFKKVYENHLHQRCRQHVSKMLPTPHF